MKQKIKDIIETVRPTLQADGGDIEFVDFIDDIVKVRLKGACNGCPMSTMTLKMAVEEQIKQIIPSIKGVEQVK